MGGTVKRARRHRRTVRLALAAWLTCACLPAAAAAQDDAPPPRREPIPSYVPLIEPVAPLLFLDARTRQFLPAPVAELRAAGEAAVAASVMGAVDAGLLDELQRRHRVRSGLDLGRDFLHDVLHETGARRVVVVDLLFDTGIVMAAGRLIDAADGRLLGAGAMEPEAWSEPDAWRDAVNRMVAALLLDVARHRPEPGDDLLIALPVHVRGLERADGVTATHTLLQTLLDDGRFRLPDPGVVNHLLLESGHDPRLVDAGGQQALAETLGAARLLSADIISYDGAAGIGPAVDLDPGATAAPRLALPSFSYTVRITDLTEGVILDCVTLYQDDRPEDGWFGIVHSRSTRGVLHRTAQRLAAELGFHTEANP